VSVLTSWRTAVRISVRELRRARGRSALVAAMIAVPVLALNLGLVTLAAFDDDPVATLDRRLGAADARLEWNGLAVVQQSFSGVSWNGGEQRDRPPTTDEVARSLPAGSRVVPVREGVDHTLRTDSGSAHLSVDEVAVDDPINRGRVRLLRGRAPTGPGELAVTEAALRDLGARLGATVRSADGWSDHTLVGVVEFPADLGPGAVVAPQVLPGPVNRWYVQAPGGVDWSRVRQLNALGVVVSSRSVTLHPPSRADGLEPDVGSGYSADELGYAGLAVTLGVLEIVLLAGPAFAVGARRRRHELALVAANGGNAAHLRRIVLADGLVLGLLGAGAGTVLGTALAGLALPLSEAYLMSSRSTGFRFPPVLLAVAVLAVLTGMLAALVPAFTAARQDVVTALSGRQGVVRSRRRWLVLGTSVTAVGVGLLALPGPGRSMLPLYAGITLGEFGLVLCTPALVGLVARLGRYAPLAVRIALRDSARNRAAAAPAVAAVMAAVAGSVAIGMFVVSEIARSDAGVPARLPPGQVAVIRQQGEQPVSAAAVRDAVARHLPVTSVVEVGEASCPTGPEAPAPGRTTAPGDSCGLSTVVPPDRACPYPSAELPEEDRRRALADPRCGMRYSRYESLLAEPLVDDGTALAALTGATGEDLARAQAVLRAGGVVVTDDRLVTDGTVQVRVQGPDPDAPPRPLPPLPGYVLSDSVGGLREIYSPAAVARAGLRVRQWGFLLATPVRLEEDEGDRLTTAVQAVAPDLLFDVNGERNRTPEQRERPTLLLMAIISGLITLGAAGIATGLAAAESRRDLTTLAAVGAGPGLRRTLSLCQSGVIAGLGSVLGIVAGSAGATAILVAANRRNAGAWPRQEPYPLLVPWSVVGVLVVVPLVAMLGAGLLTRSRLPIERRRA
jgi:putative ABC transport system permease protein